ncbi:hypothetical protein ACGFYV_36775 [Streptomyces sp. NPDC048297]|uniref:hypothetical protein n=1 Tax=Streptomyces sp. NPDC048297 TaxID=3365531 RepID=UPI003723D7DA
MGSEKQVCPVCGQPAATIVGRHKTLGTWVPVWGPGPCHNPDCPAHVAPATEPATTPDTRSGTAPHPDESASKKT